MIKENLKIEKWNNNLLFLIFFFSFLGYYATILLVANFVGLDTSRQFTIPIRLLISSFLIIIFLKNFRTLRWSLENKLFIFFALFYLMRIFIDYNNAESYYLNFISHLMFFVSFAVFPFLILNSVEISQKKIKSIFVAIFYSGLVFSILTLIYYRKFIGQVSRLTSSLVDEAVLSPLALSYCSTLIMGVFILYLLHNKTKISLKVLMLLTIGLSFVPFFLGASRGSLLALFLCFIIYFVLGRNFSSFLKSSVIIISGFFAIVALDKYLQSGLLERLLSTSDDIETGSSGASRIKIWESSFNQFLNNPLIGDKLAVDNWINYPHNIILEVLQTTGILGFIPFVLLIILAWKRVLYIGKFHKKYFWVISIFILSFAQHMVSGSIYTASWMWTSMAVVFSLYHNLKRN